MPTNISTWLHHNNIYSLPILDLELIIEVKPNPPYDAYIQAGKSKHRLYAPFTNNINEVKSSICTGFNQYLSYLKHEDFKDCWQKYQHIQFDKHVLLRPDFVIQIEEDRIHGLTRIKIAFIDISTWIINTCIPTPNNMKQTALDLFRDHLSTLQDTLKQTLIRGITSCP